MASYEHPVGQSDEWYTPPEVFEALGLTFDLDVASPGPDIVPWIPTKTCYTRDSLTLPWNGLVWMNPPFGSRNAYVPWAKKFVEHGNGIALAPDRTSAPWFRDFALAVDGILFWSPKIKFIKPDGTRGKSPGTGTALLGMGEIACTALKHLHGTHGFYCRIGHES